MKKTSKNHRNDKLALNQETVRVMTLPELANAIGGSWATSWGQGGNSRATCCEQ
ncbi:MAG TPA: hypothetical protein VIX73_26680 [Kofleriaceae bacterium]|jgi:hypothetical protein